jgi:hypothetical protein
VDFAHAADRALGKNHKINPGHLASCGVKKAPDMLGNSHMVHMLHMLHMVTDVVILLVGVGYTFSQTWLVGYEVMAINSQSSYQNGTLQASPIKTFGSRFLLIRSYNAVEGNVME